MRMTRNMYEELTDCSLVSAWRVLRKHCLPQVLGPDYCPVPDIDTSQYFDMNEVFAVITKVHGGSRRFDQSHPWSPNCSRYFSGQTQRTVRRCSAAIPIRCQTERSLFTHVQFDRRFEVDLQMTRDGVKKQLYSSIDKMKTIGTELNWDVDGTDAVHAFVDRRPSVPLTIKRLRF